MGGPTGQYDVAWQVLDIAHLVTNFFGCVLVANFDCFRAAWRIKISICIILFVLAAFAFIDARCFSKEWGEPTNCDIRTIGDVGGISMREFALSGSTQACL